MMKESHNTTAGTQLNNKMYSTSSFNKNLFKIKQVYKQNGNPMRSNSPVSASRTTNEWMKSRQNDPKISPNIAAPGPARNEQAGSISAYAEKANDKESPKREIKRQPTETGNQNDSSQRSSKIILKQEERNNEFLKKYSKENLLKSVKRDKKNYSKNRFSNQQSSYIEKVSFNLLISLQFEKSKPIKPLVRKSVDYSERNKKLASTFNKNQRILKQDNPKAKHIMFPIINHK
jgi:hypothetical protein